MNRATADAGSTGRLAAAWGVAGVALIFVDAILQLGRRGIATVAGGLDGVEWAALVVVAALFVYGEGERALRRRWVPHMLDRAAALRSLRSPVLRALAPLHALSLIGPPARELVRGWVAVAGIVAAVLVVRALPEPWRGIIDLAVALALSWGLLAIVRGARGAVLRGSGRRGSRP